MSDENIYDVAIIGGGLAGLSLSIQSARAGYRTILFEKERYPFHRVCGEYISLESWNFLEDLGIPLSQMDLPIINQLLVTAPNGKELRQDLPLGGFGISRFKLDALLAGHARQQGMELREETKISEVNFRDDIFILRAGASETRARVVAGSFGKRSNLDIKWKRNFAIQKANKLNNYIGIKYQVRIDLPADLISLHNFENGYCGISRIEEGKFCLCYLTTAQNLESCNHSIPEMEKRFLRQNPHLEKIFSDSEMLFQSPVAISQISFAKKSQLVDHVLMVGDAAGMITPLCGNGMSMAMHGSKLAFEQINLFLQKKIPRWQMEEDYSANWQKQFSRRLRTGRFIQRFFGSRRLSNLLISFLRPFPALVRALVRQTHGQPF